MIHHHCACPWCQGKAMPPHPQRDQTEDDLRKEYEKLLRMLDAPHPRPKHVPHA